MSHEIRTIGEYVFDRDVVCVCECQLIEDSEERIVIGNFDEDCPNR